MYKLKNIESKTIYLSMQLLSSTVLKNLSSLCLGIKSSVFLVSSPCYQSPILQPSPLSQVTMSHCLLSPQTPNTELALEHCQIFFNWQALSPNEMKNMIIDFSPQANLQKEFDYHHYVIRQWQCFTVPLEKAICENSITVIQKVQSSQWVFTNVPHYWG